MIDAFDVDEKLIDAAEHCAEKRRVAEDNADSANDDATFEETKQAAAAAYSQQVAGKFAAWALRGVK